MNGHELAACFVAETRWENLPAEVQRKARMCFADGLAATIAGTLTRVSRIAGDYAVQAWGGNEATVLHYTPARGLYGGRATAPGAAFANGNAANGLDLDDSARYAYGHAGAQIFPTALAVAEALDRTGAEMLTAMVIGYEVAHRVGRCWHASRNIFQACGSWGSVACAAAAAHLMRLSPEQAGHALGIAEYQAGNLPMMRDIDDPAMVKHGIGWAAMTGATAAGLAARGYTGIPTLLALPEYQEWASDIGENYLMVDGVAWKAARYACCGWAHAGVEGALRLVREHAIDLGDIARITVAGSKSMVRLGTRLPSTTEEAQFNQAWPLAAMLVDGEIGPAQMLESRLSDPKIRALAAKVDVVESEEMERLCWLYEQGDPRGRFASTVTIALRDGQEICSGVVDGGLRFPQPGWDEARMEEKFRWATGFVLGKERINALANLLWRFDKVPSVRELITVICPTAGEESAA
jgi:2-methylcitrate dehydratase PrpD